MVAAAPQVRESLFGDALYRIPPMRRTFAGPFEIGTLLKSDVGDTYDLLDLAACFRGVSRAHVGFEETYFREYVFTFFTRRGVR